MSLSGSGLAGTPDPPAAATTEVVVTLAAPPLSAFGSGHDLPRHAAYARRLDAAQEQAVRNVLAAIPSAQVRWKYRVVLNGLAVVVPNGQIGRLARVPGIRAVWPAAIYHGQRAVTGGAAAATYSPGQIGADTVWGSTLANAGSGIKIGIIDDGIDASHPYFDAAGNAYPSGFPKGQTRFATPKVVVQRTFAPASPSWKYASTPFDPDEAFHGTHVAGIAAGVHATPTSGYGPVSGVAPNALLGNYKALTIPTPDYGLDGNAPEIAAAIEAAVADGMDVINLSLGEPEIEPSRDVVVAAIEGAARAGVVPVIAAGNDFSEFGYGSVGSPANAPSAITVAAVDEDGVVASFSSAGPTPISLTLKPDLSAPGVDVLSSLPRDQGGLWGRLQGTSMASPHVAGAAALLKQQRPSWTVAQIKSALVQTAGLAKGSDGREASVLRQGAGIVNLPRALDPLLFASPTAVTFPAGGGARTVLLEDAGGGAGRWNVATRLQGAAAGVTVDAPASVDVPGRLTVSAAAAEAVPTGAYTGFVTLSREEAVRRIPFLLVVSRPALGKLDRRPLVQPGLHSGTTKGGSRAVSSYRYPTGGDGFYPGPETVFRVRIARPVANFGVVVLSGKAVPHVVSAGDENRLTGYVGLPLDLNPYFATFGERRQIAGAVLPAPGLYDVVFDTHSPTEAGPFRFRLWVNDTVPPRLRVVPSPPRTISVAATDAGAGVDPRSIVARVDGRRVTARFRDGRIVFAATPGRRRIAVEVSDHQERKNQENVHRIKPNTAVLERTVFVPG